MHSKPDLTRSPQKIGLLGNRKPWVLAFLYTAREPDQARRCGFLWLEVQLCWGKASQGAVVENSYCACRSATAGGQKDAVNKNTAGGSHKQMSIEPGVLVLFWVLHFGHKTFAVRPSHYPPLFASQLLRKLRTFTVCVKFLFGSLEFASCPETNIWVTGLTFCLNLRIGKG